MRTVGCFVITALLMGSGALWAEEEGQSVVEKLVEVHDQKGLGEVITRDVHYPDGGLRERQWFAKTADRGYIPHGPFVQFHANGTQKTMGHMVLGLRHGKWKETTLDGQVTEGEYRDGRKAGQWLTWSKTKKLRLEENYHGGKLHGVRRTYYDNDRLGSEVEYVNGVRHGHSKTWFSNGMLAREDNWISGRQHGSMRHYDEYGVRLVRGEYFMGSPIGKWEWRNLKDEVVRKEDLRDGTGTFCTYIVTGEASEGEKADRKVVLQEEVEIKNGKRHGKQCIFYPSGSKRLIAHYEEGKLEGPFKEWYANGRLRIEASYKMGEPVGTYTEYHPNDDAAYEELIPARITTLSDDGRAKVQEFDLKGSLSTKQTLQYGKPDGAFVRYYPDGKVLEEGQFVEGDKSGAWKEYYPSGELRLVETYRVGQLDGPVEEWYESVGSGAQKKKTTGFFVSGERDGKWLSWYPDGSLQASKFFRLGKEEGEYKEYWAKTDPLEDEQKLKAEGIFILGQKEGEWKVWHANGMLKSRAYFKHGQQHGPVEEWYDFKVKNKPALRVKGTFRYGVQEGTWTAYYPDGQAEYLQTYRNGKLHGTAQQYYESGNLKHQAYYDHGRQQGEVLTYYPNKKLKSKSFFVDGTLDGAFATYHENGKLSTQGLYKRGLPVGEWHWFKMDGRTVLQTSTFKDGSGTMYEFYSDGKPRTETAFVLGVKSGKQMAWYQSGVLKSTKQWKNGLLHGAYKELHESGKPLIAATYLNGQRHGTYKSWYGNERPRIHVEFNTDQLEGVSKEWYENGQLKSAGQWVKGARHGAWQWFDRYGDELFKMNYNKGIVTGVEAELKQTTAKK